MRKIVCSIILIFIFTCNSYSQFDVQFSQYMLNPSAFNPAAVGESGMIDVIGQYRLQWLGMPNGGKSLNFNINSPIKIGKMSSGVGFLFNNERVGQFTNQDLHLQYAYKRKIGNGVLSIGTDLGFVSLGFNGDSTLTHKVTLGEYTDYTTDQDIPSTYVSGMSFDMGIGAWYSNPKIYAGVSYQHLNRPSIDWGDKTGFRRKSALLLTAGFNNKIADSKLILQPSMLVKSDFVSWQFDLTAKIDYDNKFWGGLSYRLQDAVVILAGVNVSDGFSIGYSYDLPASQIIRASSGSHEVLMIYSFAYVFAKKNTKYKSVRYL